MKRPVVGIEADADVSALGRRFARVYETYYEAVFAGGGTPVLLPPLDRAEHVQHALEAVDAVIVPGGDDLPASEYGQETLECPRLTKVDETRFKFGRELVRSAVRQAKPFLGICYGHQLLNVALGGALVQDIEIQVPKAVVHRIKPGEDAHHEVSIDDGSLLSQVCGTGGEVNSAHHQAVERPGRGLKVVAHSKDGLVEAVEGEGRFLVGVQWHPERMGAGKLGWGLIEALVQASG
jgi:putative glutamine amidotransferase